MKRYWAFNGLMSSAALLLPMAAVPESRVETGAANATTQATAHVNFKIVIPKVLYLQVGGTDDRSGPADTVAIMSNSRNVWLTATVRTADRVSGGGDRSPQLAKAGRGNAILSAAARKVIAQDTVCTVGDPHPAPASATQVICTVSMP